MCVPTCTVACSAMHALYNVYMYTYMYTLCAAAAAAVEC